MEENIAKIYSVSDIADFCGVVSQTALNWLNNGELEGQKDTEGAFFVKPSCLLAFMQKRNMHIPEAVVKDSGLSLEENVPSSVLIVDDDQAWNTIIMQFLKKRFATMQIFQAFNGFEAGSQMVIKQPKCVILDLDLPGADGRKLCRYIKESDAFGKPAIIVVTALEDEAVEKYCLSLGVAKFFRKPLNLPALAEALKTIGKR